MKNFRISIVFIAAALLSAGCIKETQPQGSTLTAKQVSSSSFALDGMVNSIGSTMTTTDFLGYGEVDHWDFGLPSIHIMTENTLEDMAICGDEPGYNRYYPWKQNRYMGPDDGVNSYFWDAYYTYIRIANSIIKTIDPETATAAAKNNLGQAYAWRAFYYLDMARLYEPKENKYTDVTKVKDLTVPIVTEKTTEEEAFNNPRVKKDVMYEFILSDLKQAEEYLNPAIKDYTNPTLAAVYALYAKAYLEMGWWDDDKSTEYFENAVKYADKAISTSGKTPLTQAQWEDPANGFNNGAANNSWIWGLKTSAENLGNLQHFTSMMSNEAKWGYATNAILCINVNLYNLISPSDFRKHSWVDPAYLEKPSAGKPYNYKHAGSAQDWDELLEKFKKTPYFSIKFRPAGGECNDYTVGGVADHCILRVEDLWFVKAEALAKLGKIGDAQKVLEEFMSHRYVGETYTCSKSDTEEKFLNEMLLQKRIEFWGEGVLVFDYKRLNRGITRGFSGTNEAPVFCYNTEGRSPVWNLVIPVEELNTNTGITTATNNPNPTGLIPVWSEE